MPARTPAWQAGGLLHLNAGGGVPGAEAFDERCGAVAEPAVELGGLFELLAALAGDEDETAVPFRESGHVTPELLELRDREDVFLAFAPALLHVLQRDVGRD